MCCDGTLFDFVAFAEGDARARLRVIREGRGFAQPCAAHDGACAIYETRPSACRAFVCELLDRHAREGASLDACLAIVRRARELLANRVRSDELDALMRHFDRA